MLTRALRQLLEDQARAPSLVPSPGHTEPVLAYLATGYPDGFWVATAAGRTVGFSAAVTRAPVWFLATLFVLPEYQGGGVGRELLRCALRGSLGPAWEGVRRSDVDDHDSPRGDHRSGRLCSPASGGSRGEERNYTLAVVSSGGNPISNRLYAHHGMYPWLPVMYLEAELPLRLPRMPPSDLEPSPLAAEGLSELVAIDALVTGVDRTSDHAWMLSCGRRGWVFRRQGRAVAYALHGGDGSEGPGQVGPVAALASEDVAAVIAFTLDQLDDVPSATIMVPGVNLAGQELLWRCGFSFHGVVALLGASRPFGQFDRYTFAGDVLM